jgi:hypothetical protein
VARQAKYPQDDQLGIAGLRSRRGRISEGIRPSFCLGRPKPVQSKNEFFENKSSGSCGLRANLFDGPAKG